MLTAEARSQLQRERVIISRDGFPPLAFAHLDFIAVNQREQLTRLGELVPAGSSARRAARALAALGEEHAVVLERTLRALVAGGAPVVDVPDDLGLVVAVFPLRT